MPFGPRSWSDIAGVHEVSKLFARQDGLATVTQLSRLRVTDAMLRSRIATGEWERLDRDLIGLSGARRTWRRQVRSAVLSVSEKAAVSHVTAARVHGFDGFAREPEIHVTVAGSGHHNVLAGHRVHRSTLLRTEDCVTIDGLMVVSKPIALIGVAAPARSRRDPPGAGWDAALR